MTTHAIGPSQAFIYGVKETMNSAVKKAPVILGVSAVAAGIGYVVAGSAAAYTTAKISSCVLLALYGGIGHPAIVGGISTPSELAFRFVGNITPLVLPPLFFFMR